MPQDSPDTCNREFITGRLPWLVAGAALVLYLVTLTPWLAPSSLALASNVSGFDWQPMLFQPLVFLLTLPLRWLPVAWVPLAMNLLSAVLAAITLGLLARSVALLPQNRLPQQRSLENSRHSLLSVPLAWVPVLLATAGCGLQLTFWQHSITGTGEMVDLVLLAAIFRGLLEYRVDRNLAWLRQGFFLMGLAVANAWAFIGFAPLFLAAVIALGWKDLLSMKLIRQLLLLGLAGFSLFLLLPVVQTVFNDSELSLLRALRHTAGSYFGMVKAMARGARAFPHIAIVVASGSLLPLLFMSIRWRRHAGSTGWTGELLSTGLLYLTHFLLLLGCLWALFDLPFSPRRAVTRLGVSPPLLTFIYLAAMGLGYYSGFFLLLSSRLPPHRRRATPVQRVTQTFGRWATASLVVIVPGLLLLKNLPLIREFNTPAYRTYAELAAAQLPAGPTYLFSDDLLRLTLLRTALAGRPNGSDYVFLDTRALPFGTYWSHLHQTHPTRWPERPPGLPPTIGALPARLEAGLLTYGVRSLVESNQVCYLMPGFGTFFDAVYAEPQGTIYPLTAYPRAVLSPPALTDERRAANEQFWKTTTQPLREMIARQQRRLNPQLKSARQQLFKRFGLEDEMPLQATQVANWLSAAAVNFGVRLQQEGSPQAATWYFEEARRLRPDNVPVQFNLTANTNLLAGQPVPYIPPAEIAEQYGKRRDWSLVMRESGPFDHPAFCYDFGLVFGQAGFLRQATQQFDRTRKLAPGFLPAWLRLGGFLNLLRMPEHTLQIVGDLRREPLLRATLATNALDVALLEADALLQKEDTALAQAVLRDAIEATPSDPDALARAMDVYIRHQRWTEAEALLDVRFAKQPNDARALITLGYLKLKQGAFSNAIPTLTRALAQPLGDDQQVAALLNRAICHLRLDDLSAARRDYEKLLSLAPKSFQGLYGLGEIALREGRDDEAIRCYRGYLTNAPAGLEEAENVRQRLRELERPRR